MTRIVALLLVLTSLLGAPAQADEGARVLAASSLTEVLEDCAARYVATTGGPRPRIVFGASSALARQLEAGAPADLVVLADPAWVDALEPLLAGATRQPLLANRLVVVVPRGSLWRPRSPLELTALPSSRLAVAGVAVPAGSRAREALAHHGVLEALEGHLVSAPSVRGALALVAQAEVPAGVVYATDAQAEPEVEVAFAFAVDAHAPIVYPLALTRDGAEREEARRFYAFLRGPDARRIFAAAGFRPLSPADEPLEGEAAAEQGAEAAPRGERDTHGAAGPDGSRWVEPLLRSLWVASLSVLLSIVPALAFGWVLARRRFPGKALVNTAILAPLVLPPVVTGYLLLWLFGRSGPLGPPLAALGLQVTFTRWAAVLAAAVVGFPLLILMIRQAIESVDPGYEQQAETLGLHPFVAFCRVTLPMALPGVLSGCLLAFARAMGEFGATVIVASDVPGETRTLAMAVYALYELPGGEQPARRLVWASLVVCFLALIGYEWLSRAQRRRTDEGAP